MATDTEMLERIERRQLSTLAVVDEILGVLETHTEMLAAIDASQKELAEWLREPPSSDMADLLKRLTASVERMEIRLSVLPADVARAVHDGELDGRG
jgi:hypothetical protein